MLDDAKTTFPLIDALEEQLPFEVGVTPALAQRLVPEGLTLDPSNRYTVSRILYLGSEGGIAVHLEPADGARVVIASLTHIVFPSRHPLAPEVHRYQKRRTRKLKRQDRF